MEFGIAYPARPDAWKDLVIAEAHGFTHAWFYDSQMIYSDVYACMALAAERTKSIKLATGVAIPSNRTAPVFIGRHAEVRDGALVKTAAGAVARVIQRVRNRVAGAQVAFEQAHAAGVHIFLR